MGTQLPLFSGPESRTTADWHADTAAAWVLDEETRAIGRRHVAEARAILRAQRVAAGHGHRRHADAQPAA